MSPQSNLARTAFPLLLAAFVLLALAYSVTIPLGEAPDEVSHFAFIDYLTAQRQMPTLGGAAVGEAHQPPLYYLIGALSTSWIPRGEWQFIANPDFVIDDPQTPDLLVHTRREAFPYQGGALAWHLARLLSVAMGAVTVWATWRIAMILFQEDQWLAFGATAFVAFLPEFTFLSGMVNNDNLVVMLSSLSVLQILRMQYHLWSKREAIILGLLLGLAALTKLSGLVVWLFAFVLFLGWGWRERQKRSAALHFALCYGTAALVVSPWVAYNLIHFGDPLGWSQVLAVTPTRQTGMTLGDWLSIAQGLFTSFAGRFGGALQLKLSAPYYFAFGLGLVLMLFGWIGYARDARAGKLHARTSASLQLFALFWLLMLAAYGRWTLAILGTDQARQLFPGLPLLAIILIAGLARLAPASKKGVMLALGVGGFALTLAVLLHLSTLYAPPAAFAQLNQARAPTDFGKTIRVISYRIDQTRIGPGASIGVQVFWQALKDPREDYWLLLQLVGPDGAVANKDGIPSAGRRTTDWWRAGEILTSRHTLIVPDDVAPGTYTLELGLHPFGRWDWLRVHGQDMLALGTIHVMPKTGE
jgi:4-amino-4-deoxy-L-arabinose transferase-like glycosyltransferase